MKSQRTTRRGKMICATLSHLRNYEARVAVDLVDQEALLLRLQSMNIAQQTPSHAPSTTVPT